MASKKKKSTALHLCIVFLVLAGGSYGAWWWYTNHATNFVTYKEFGIAVPNNYIIHGIDVSHHQDNINWDLVHSMEVRNIKIGFSFIKATEGIGRVDNRFNRNWTQSKDVGMYRGAYHFFSPSKSGKLQAQNFIDVVELQPGDLPPVLDIEQINGVSKTKLRKELKAFLQTAQDYYGVKPIIYTNADFYTHYLDSTFDQYPLWVAHYLQQDTPRIKRDWLFWQYSETGRVNGVVTKVDFNVFNGDSASFKNLLLQ